MSKSITISHFNFPLYMLGSGLSPLVPILLSTSAKSILIFMIIWTTWCLIIYVLSRKILWIDQKYLFIKMHFKTFKFDRNTTTINVENPIFSELQLTISESKCRVTIRLPFYVSEHYKRSTKTRLDQFCKNNRINYTTS